MEEKETEKEGMNFQATKAETKDVILDQQLTSNTTPPPPHYIPPPDIPIRKMSTQTVPTDKRRLRACLLCGLVRSHAEFTRSGCANDRDLLGQISGERGRQPAPEKYTSASYSGLIALMQPDSSWVAKWQRNDKCAPGLYAVRVHGKLSGQMIDDLEDIGFKYRPRDGSAAE
ncbi:hypothetical protein HK097_001716 [Rhizophlyctis rosea]|uniref:Transcription elongation factor SPT4 n=1 Tax=Rhizophlyctis rosea TaxID=64517 RepID=A0AAD5WY71_9FUNG|nr:hypothetical protein HK097_001716 [Rhizophlyctis rosea]